MTRFLTTAALLALSATTAFAGEGNGDPFPFRPAAATMAVNTIPMLPSTGSQAEAATANSAPPGFQEGTQADQRADSVRAYFAGKTGGAAGIAMTNNPTIGN